MRWKRWISDVKSGTRPLAVCVSLFLSYFLTDFLVGCVFSGSLSWKLFLVDGASLLWCVPAYLYFVRNRRGDVPDYRASGTGAFLLSVLFFGIYVMSQGFGSVIQKSFMSDYLDTYGSIVASDRELIVYMIASVTVGPVLEELLFRGFLYRFLTRKYHRFVCVLVSCAAFTAIHGTYAHIPVAVGLTVFCCFVYELYGKVRYCMFAHILYNAISVTVIFSVPKDAMGSVGFVIGFFIMLIVTILCFWKSDVIRSRFRRGSVSMEDRIRRRRDAYLDSLSSKQSHDDSC